MSKTSRELATRVMGICGLLENGQTPDASDVSLVQTIVLAKLAELELRRITYVGDYEQIDDGIFLLLSQAVAPSILDDFGITGGVEDRIIQKAQLAEVELRTIMCSDPTFEAQQAEYY